MILDFGDLIVLETRQRTSLALYPYARTQID
jgi:hypothetical protein